MSRRAAALALAVLTPIAAPGSTAAHEAAAVLDVLAGSGAAYACDAGSSVRRPLLLRTSIGLARAIDDGRYEHLCPSSYGSATATAVASSADGSVLATAAVQGAWVSTDSGCTFSSLPLPGEGLFAYDATVVGQTPVFLARDATRAVVLTAAEGVLRERLSFEREGQDAFTPDSVAPLPDGTVLVTGARPTPAIWLVDPSDGAGERIGVPDAPASLQRLSVRRTDDSGAWLMLTTELGRSLAYLDLSGAVPTLNTASAPGTVVHGPASLDGTDYAVVDEQLVRIERPSGVTTVLAPVDWTCLDQVGEQVYACRLYELFEVIAVDGTSVDTRTAFTARQFAGPSDFCSDARSSEQVAACAQDWVHLGGENNLLTDGGATCPDGSGRIPDAPDGSGLDDDDGTADDAGGCASTAPAGSLPAWCAMLLAAIGTVHRRRRAAS